MGLNELVTILAENGFTDEEIVDYLLYLIEQEAESVGEISGTFCIP